MNRCFSLGICGSLLAAVGVNMGSAQDGTISSRREGTNILLQIRGNSNEDWRLLSSTDLRNWNTNLSFGTLLSGGASAPWRRLDSLPEQNRFYRALKTGGLYDRTVLRTMNLTFTQANWQTHLTTGRTTGSNTLCVLEVDNGVTLNAVGARYRGNTSFTGFGGSAPVKKSIALDLNWTDSAADLMGYDTLNLNNAYQDETIMRESLYFNIMRHYTVCPAAALVQLYINETNWGVYSHAQQQNGDLIREYFPSNKGNRWRAPNMAAGGPGGGSSALLYLGNTNLDTYRSYYELKSAPDTNALPRLIHAIYVLNTTTNDFRNTVEEVLAVDRWLWFLAIENVFADDDSYWNKGADYMVYYEPESGRLHPVEHDGNEAFVAADASLSPVQGATDVNRPVLRRLLGVPELRQRYLAHMRTLIHEFFNPETMTPLINEYVRVSFDAVSADPKKGYTSMVTYSNDLRALQSFVTNRYTFLSGHLGLRQPPPQITAVRAPEYQPSPRDLVPVTAEVLADGTNGIDSVWLYHRSKTYGRFTSMQMFDDGEHADASMEDGLFGGFITNYPAGTQVQYYLEARSANPAKAACFAPERAEQETYSYRVGLISAPFTSVVINEFMADNASTLKDPQGQFDDWIELHNVSQEVVDLTGCYLTDDRNNPRKWRFPDGTRISPDGYLLIWADENGSDSPGLHANFKLAKTGEEIYLIDTDANSNAVLDHVAFGAQRTDVSYARLGSDADKWEYLAPTPGQPNGG